MNDFNVGDFFPNPQPGDRQRGSVYYERVYLCGLRASGSTPPPAVCPEHGHHCPNNPNEKGRRPSGW